MRDFNFPTIDWKGEWTNEENDTFCECLRESFLCQMRQKPNLIDLVLVNDGKCILDITHSVPLGKGYHDTHL